MKDPLGERIKENYENRTRYYIPRRTYAIIRLDGSHFHTYTRGLNKPFDNGLIQDMDSTIIAIMGEIQNAVFVYTQSDEISILLTDFAKTTTSAWFDGNIQKMVSTSASLITGQFNRFRARRYRQELQASSLVGHYTEDGVEEEYVPFKIATFDSRIFTIPDRIEVMNYFRWRQQDCVRNSVSMVAQSLFSPKELHGKSQSSMHEMMHKKGVNWATDYSDSEKNGRIIVKEEYEGDIINTPSGPKTITKSKWGSMGAWVFTKDEGKLLSMIPEYPE